MTPLLLPPGTTGFSNERNEFQVTGSQMGRRNTLPRDLPDGDWLPGTKLRLVHVHFVDGDYDQGGAYWGRPANPFMATEGALCHSIKRRMGLVPCGVTVYVRGNTRAEAKAAVLKLVPDAKFNR